MENVINFRTSKASGTFAHLSGRVCDKPRLKWVVYRACVYTLLFGSKMYTLSTVQEKKINTFHQCCLRRILKIRWQHKITNEEVLRPNRLNTLS